MKNINTKKYIEQFVKIRDKVGRIIDFKLNEPQQKLYDIIKEQKKLGKPVRIIILKARQMGFSTLTESILFKETATKFNVNTGIIAHKEEATTNLFTMSKRIYDNLPEEMKPAKKSSNAKELIFDNKEGTGLKSKIKCMTAGADGVGRSDTFNNLHISELAFWGDGARETMLGLMQAVPNAPNTMVIIESTANGYEYFKDMWDKAVKGESDFIPLFVGWQDLKEYQMEYTGFTLTEEEEKIKAAFNLTNEQLTWRRWCIANNCGGDLNSFKQEYPMTPEEAFITSGTPVFDKVNLVARIETAPKPLKVGYFDYDYDGNTISNIRWVNDSNGYIKLFRLPGMVDNTKYCIGGDTAGEGSDYYTGYVIDAKSGKQVASLRHQFDADLYTRQMYCLGKYYKYTYRDGREEDALIGIEVNFDSYPIRELQRLGYERQYIREQLDSYTGKMEKKYGFRTTSITRPTILSFLISLVRENVDLIDDTDILRELLTIVKNEKGRIEAPEGGHDDQMMGLAITYEVRNQVIIDEEPIDLYPAFDSMFIDPSANEKEKIVVF
jgi:hypothetical protein